MVERTFVAYCTNGLGNRLHPLASAIAYCRLTGRRLRVYWDAVTPSGCLAPLDRLFQNKFETITLGEIAALGQQRVGLFTERPNGQGVRREAEHFGRDALFRLSGRAPARDTQALRLDDPNEVVVAFGNEFFEGVPRSLSVDALRGLKPQADILARVNAQADALGLAPQTQAVHARGTDFEVHNALALYSELIARKIGGQRFYLSTEDAQLEAGLRKCFHGQVLSRADRLHLRLNHGKRVWNLPDSYTNSVDHGVDALTDLYLLSCVSLTVAHPDSTFAAVARHLHGVLDRAPRAVAAEAGVCS